jgi:hypothetical protein
MKKLLFAAMFVLVANVAMAQSQAFKDDVKKLMVLSGTNAQVDFAKKQVVSMVAADKQQAFLKDFEASLKPLFDAQENFYLTEYTHDEVKQLVKFYESPVGKKMAEKNAKLTEVTMPVIQQWSMELQGLIMKYQ